MANVLIIHPDQDVRARLVEALENVDDLGVELDVQIDQVASLEAAVEVEPRPDAIVIHLPPGVGPEGTGEGPVLLPDALLFLPSVMVLDDHDPDSLGRALWFEPAGVLPPDFDPGLATVAVRCALDDAGFVLDRSLVPAVLDLMKRVADGEGATEA